VIHESLSTPGGRIRLLRTAKGWTQVTLASKVHSSQPAVSQWEKDRWLPEPYMRKQLAEILGTTQTFLFGEIAAAAEVRSAS
jgi:transcriptional regulator with XRE-family HTH domain